MRVLDLLAPTSCVGCAKAGYVWCLECRTRAARPGRFVLPGYDGAAAVFAHQGSARAAVLAGKFGGQRRVAGVFASEAHVSTFEPGVVVVAVPDHAATKSARGGCLAEAFARALARRAGWVHASALRKPVATKDQAGLDPASRWKEQTGAFELRGTWRGASILLVDDVVTTGATAVSAATVLREGGVSSIGFLAMTASPMLVRDSRSTG